MSHRLHVLLHFIDSGLSLGALLRAHWDLGKEVKSFRRGIYRVFSAAVQHWSLYWAQVQRSANSGIWVRRHRTCFNKRYG